MSEKELEIAKKEEERLLKSLTNRKNTRDIFKSTTAPSTTSSSMPTAESRTFTPMPGKQAPGPADWRKKQEEEKRIREERVRKEEEAKRKSIEDLHKKVQEKKTIETTPQVLYLYMTHEIRIRSDTIDIETRRQGWSNQEHVWKEE